jgi:hypothetical protein
MTFPLQPCVHLVMQTTLAVLVAALLLPQHSRAECKEFKIVEYEDRVEAVCVGEPLTDAQKKANLEEEKRQEAEAQRQRIEEQKHQREAGAAGKSRAETESSGVRKRRGKQPVTPQQPVNRNATDPQNL